MHPIYGGVPTIVWGGEGTPVNQPKHQKCEKIMENMEIMEIMPLVSAFFHANAIRHT